MAGLSGLKKKTESEVQEDLAHSFIAGAEKRIKDLETRERKFIRYTFSLTEEISKEIDDLLVESRVAKANRSIILKAALHQLQKLSPEELQRAVLEEIR